MGAEGMFCTKLYGLIDVLNNNFGDDWCITGSAAIYIYLSILEEKEQVYLLDVEPNDIDILVKGNKRNTDVRYIGDYKRESDLQLRSSIYKRKDGFSLNLTFTSSVSMLEVNCFEKRLSLHNFKNLKTDYIEFLDDYEGNKKEENKKKIKALSQIEKCAHLFPEKKKRKHDLMYEARFMPILDFGYETP